MEYHPTNENEQATTTCNNTDELTNIILHKRSQGTKECMLLTQKNRQNVKVGRVVTLGGTQDWKEVLGRKVGRVVTLGGRAGLKRGAGKVVSWPGCWLHGGVHFVKIHLPTLTICVLFLCIFVPLTLYFKIKLTTKTRQNSNSSSCTLLRESNYSIYYGQHFSNTFWLTLGFSKSVVLLEEYHDDNLLSPHLTRDEPCFQV